MMHSMYVLTFYQVSKGKVILKFPMLWRIIFLLLAVMFFTISFQENRPIWIALAAGLISLISALYYEKWEFSLDQGSFGSAVGIYPFLMKKSWDLGSLESVVLAVPRQLINKELSRHAWHAGQERVGNILSRKTARLELHLSDGQRILVYTEQNRKVERIHTLAASLSTFLHLPLIEQQH